MALGTQASAASLTSGSTIDSPAKSFSQLAAISPFLSVAWRAVSEPPPTSLSRVRIVPLLTRSKKFSAVGRHQAELLLIHDL